MDTENGNITRLHGKPPAREVVDGPVACIHDPVYRVWIGVFPG